MNLITTADEPELSSSWGFPFSELYRLIPKMALGILVNQLAIWRHIWGGQFIQTAFTLDWEHVCVCVATAAWKITARWWSEASAQKLKERNQVGTDGNRMSADWWPLMPSVRALAEVASLELLVQPQPYASVNASNADVPCLPSTLPDHV